MTKPALKSTQHSKSHSSPDMSLFGDPYSPCTPEPEDSILKYQKGAVRFVRFLLSPPPEEMETRSKKANTASQGILATRDDKKIALPIDQKFEADVFPSGSHWGKEQLRLLGVNFQMQRRLDLNKLLNVNEREWNPELRARVEEGARQLGAVNMKDITTRKVKIDEVAVKIAPQFAGVFTSLLKVMEIQEEKEEEKRQRLATLARQASQASSSIPASSGSTMKLKRPPTSPTIADSQPIKRRKSGYDSSTPSPPPGPSTPNQPTMEVDPDLTGNTAYSGDSSASKHEDSTTELLNNLMTNTQTILSEEFRNLTWARANYSIELSKTGRDTTYVDLGKETIKVTNDGGLGISYYNKRSMVRWQPIPPHRQRDKMARKSGARSVLSFEAKRMRSKKRDDVDLVYKYAGQIFAEMLGQTCHEEFYTNDQMQYQEAFVIHSSHSSITIYYAKLPNIYLREISQYGHEYLTASTYKQRIQLRRTKKFRMQMTEERVELFRLLAKLFWYLISGRSHVGYLFNWEGNPIHRIGMLDSINVQPDPILRMAQEVQRPPKLEEMMDSIVVASPPDSQEVVEGMESEGSSFSEKTENPEEVGTDVDNDNPDDDDEMILGDVGLD